MEFGLSLLSLLYLGWGLSQLAALIAVAFGYAMPRVPVFLRLLICLPLFISAFSTISITVIALTGQERLVSLDGIDLLIISSGTQFLMWWTIVACAVYFHFNGRNYGN